MVEYGGILFIRRILERMSEKLFLVLVFVRCMGFVRRSDVIVVGMIITLGIFDLVTVLLVPVFMSIRLVSMIYIKLRLVGPITQKNEV